MPKEAGRRPTDVDGTSRDRHQQPVAHFTQECGRIQDVARMPNGGLWQLTNDVNPDFVLVLPPSGHAESADGRRFHMHQKFV